MNKATHYTVIGAGNGGKAMAGHLALMGFPVTLYNRSPHRIAAIKARGGIDLESSEAGASGFGKLVCVTSDMAEALRLADIIMVVVPSSAHAEIAAAAAPHLRDGQITVLHPGRLSSMPAARTVRPRRASFALRRRCRWLRCRQTEHMRFWRR
jgi:opine dehydrogenase